MGQPQNGTIAESKNGKADTVAVSKQDQEQQPRSIPHITANLIPLSNILKFYAQESYKQLSTAIENLSTNVDEESDVKRKKYFLDIIISLRQDLLKLYTLIKWASVSQDVSKLIDLLNWFRIQDFQFDHLTHQLAGLSGFGGAKLPNFDIETALEVFYKKRPILPSHNYLQQPKISPHKVLEVLKDLNLALMTKFALIDVPPQFQFEIKDGRAYIDVSKEFQVCVTMASDDLSTDNPFYMIDFKFLFGINQAETLVTFGENDSIVTRLPTESYTRLEKIANQVLSVSGLQGLYELLHKYSISFKLYLVSKQIRGLLNTLKWKNNLQIKYAMGSSLIIVNYWTSHFLNSNWKSFIEIGIDRKFNLIYRWFRNGKYESEDVVKKIVQDREKDCGEINEDTDSLFKEQIDSVSSNDEEASAEEVHIESIISSFMISHSAGIMKMIFKLLRTRISGDIEMINSHRIMFSISPKKSAVLAINPLTGLFYFVNPTPMQNRLLKRINSPPLSFSKQQQSQQTIPENSFVEGVVVVLQQLMLETFTKEVNNYLFTTEWIHNSIIKLNDGEINNLLKSIDKTNVRDQITVQFYRRKHWPSTWFLIVMVNGLTSSTAWWVARIKSVDANWVVSYLQNLIYNPRLDYEFFKNLGKSTFKKIINHVILDELRANGIEYDNVLADEEQAGDNDAAKEVRSELDGLGLTSAVSSGSENGSVNQVTVIYKSIIKLQNTNLIPIENSSSHFYLQVELINEDNTNKMNLNLFGKLKNLSIKNSPEVAKFNLIIDHEKQNVEVATSVDLNSIINENQQHHHHQKQGFLNPIFDNLNKLNNLLQILEQLNNHKVEILDNSIDSVVVKVNEAVDKLLIQLPQNPKDAIQISAVNTKPWEIEIIIHFLNQYLQVTKSTDIVGVIHYLDEFDPIYRAVKQVQKLLNEQESGVSTSGNAAADDLKLNNGLNKICFDAIFKNLNSIQFMFNLSSTISNSRKIQKDKILISLSFKKNKFNSNDNQNLIKVSLKNNLNSKNVKFRQLFELMFKSISEMERNERDEIINLQENHLLIKLNYDFLISCNVIEEMMGRITKCFIQYLTEETK
ncbi:Rgr1 protein [Candida orthopsilosis Co 90-125]|uniref:Mediator of RNA polymerase II transcription subunit 14 n=1 Tax=Candida orthopsilosis (strain 90-125) TaxID=1136231 RepID=H8X7C4_CANO9|nr:Rgr1 protein [Candida orthopsilosis Co 90-125]CCG24053.1 Rgr1 protein [Candida orthopsilosis Co 90-125]